MKLRKYLRLRGIKITFFAKRLGVSYTTLYRYMNGDFKIPPKTSLAVKQLTDGKVTVIRD